MCNCWATHHLFYFLAGASFWEALVHISLQFSGVLPVTYWGVTITNNVNFFAIGSAIILCLIFLFLAKTFGGCTCGKSSC